VLWLVAVLVVDSSIAAQPPRAESPLSTAGAATALENTLIEAIARAEKSVVAIARVRRRAAGESPQTDPNDPDFLPNEYASGVVVGAAGLILTNYHVLGDPEQNDYYVWLQRRPIKVEAVHRVEKVVAGDPWTDLAVLRVAAEGLTAIKFADVKTLRKGMIVMVLGNPHALARDGEPSAGWGILANTGRQAATRRRSLVAGSQRETLHHFGGLLQIDARLNLGTSGAAVINLKGEMIGMMTAQTPLEGIGQAAGLAIPADDVFRRTIEHLKAGRRIQVGFLGVSVETLSQQLWDRGFRGVRVNQVVPGTAADRAGLRVADVITHIDERPIKDRNELFHYLGGLAPQAQVRLDLLRGITAESDGDREQLTAELSKRFSQLAGPAIGALPYPSWCGMQLDYATAMPPRFFRDSGHLMDSRGCVAVVKVEVDSPAWQAGIRVGSFISHVEGTRVLNPAGFHKALGDPTGATEVTLCSEDREGRVLLISPRQ